MSTAPTPRVANAPCSWGTIEGFGEVTRWHDMLDQLTESGYRGTELGDLGYMPSDPARLRAELEARKLVMLGGFEGVPLTKPGAAAERRERLLTLARLLASVSDEAKAGRKAHFILADETRGHPQRTLNAGRVTQAMALDADTHALLVRQAHQIADWVTGETGLQVLYHHHCAAWVETPDEIERFLDATDPARINLVFDTGHYTYGAGVPDDGTLALEGLKRFWSRTPYVHVKDCHPGVAARARANGWDYSRAIAEGVFCELGRGSVDFPGILAFLRAQGYSDWLTVEQDVIPGLGTPFESAKRNRAALAAWGV